MSYSLLNVTRFCLLSMILYSGLARLPQAAETACPKNIAAAENDALNLAAAKILKSLYSEMGCEVVFIELPPRRGINHFNNGLVDGELFRLRQAEVHYKRAFVRSDLPLFLLSNSLWLHPDLKANERFPIGYFLGVVWQENYMNNVEGKSFIDSEQIFRAYNDGHLRGFLSADFSVEAEVRNNRLLPPPEKGEALLEAPLFHYLGEEFAPIMKRLSQKLNDRPFKNIALEIGK